MASIGNDKNGRKRILFVAPDGSRKTIHLGLVDTKTAQSVCRHVKALLSAKIASQPLARDVASWLADIGDVLRGKLEAVGLIAPQTRVSLGAYLSEWCEGKRAAGTPRNH